MFEPNPYFVHTYLYKDLEIFSYFGLSDEFKKKYREHSITPSPNVINIHANFLLFVECGP